MAIAEEHHPLDGGRRAVGHGFVNWASEGRGVFLATLAVAQARIPSWVVVVVSVLVGGGGGNEARYIGYAALVEAIQPPWPGGEETTKRGQSPL